MIIKSFAAPTMAGALKLVKETLGGDAIVLKTKDRSRLGNLTDGNRFEITACIDETLVSKPIDEITKVNADEEITIEAMIDEQTINEIESPVDDHGSEFAEEIDQIRINLINSDVPRDLTDQIISEARTDSNMNLREKALEVIRNKFEGRIKSNLTVMPGSKIAFIGLSGAGKSSVMSKVSANLSMIPGNKLKLVTLNQISENTETDTFNKDFTKQFNIVEKNSVNNAIIMIDTPPVTFKSDNRDLIEKLSAIRPEIIFLVYSANKRSVDLLDTIERFKKLAPTYQVATHLDETDRWGGILTMTENMDIPLAFITDSPGGEGQLYTPGPDILASQILNTGAYNE